MPKRDRSDIGAFDGPFLNMDCMSDSCCGIGNIVMITIGGILVWCYISLVSEKLKKPS